MDQRQRDYASDTPDGGGIEDIKFSESAEENQDRLFEYALSLRSDGYPDLIYLQLVANVASSVGRRDQPAAIVSSQSAAARATHHAWCSKIHWALSAPSMEPYNRAAVCRISLCRHKAVSPRNTDVFNQRRLAKLRSQLLHRVRPAWMIVPV